jgi:hypothetical protein
MSIRHDRDVMHSDFWIVDFSPTAVELLPKFLNLFLVALLRQHRPSVSNPHRADRFTTAPKAVTNDIAVSPSQKSESLEN